MDIKDVENLAELSKLDLSNEEKQGILHDMKGILEYVKQIEMVKLPSESSGANKPGMQYNVHNVWREDQVEAREFSREMIIEQFPDQQDGFLKVKKIL